MLRGVYCVESGSGCEWECTYVYRRKGKLVCIRESATIGKMIYNVLKVEGSLLCCVESGSG